MTKTNKLLIVGIVLLATSLIGILVKSSIHTAEETNELERLQNEEQVLLSGINYHQTQANTLSIRLGKVKAAISGLEGLKEEPVMHSVAPENADHDLMEIVCEKGQIHGRTSPVCDNWDLFNELKSISEVRNVNFGMQIGIAYAESHIGINFAPSQDCGEANNWAGLKWHKLSSGETLPKKWRDGCWLQQFESIQEGWASMANSLDHGYIRKGCDTPECIVKWWVGKYSQRWVDAVNLFM